jgi:hypothetical protein
VNAAEETSLRVIPLSAAPEAPAQSWSRAAPARAYPGVRGARRVNAACQAAELGVPRRSANAHERMAFVGLVGNEHSSGGSRRRGPITKTCDTHARRALIEPAWRHRLSVGLIPVAPTAATGWRRPSPTLPGPHNCGRVHAKGAWPRDAYCRRRWSSCSLASGFIWAIAQVVGQPHAFPPPRRRQREAEHNEPVAERMGGAVAIRATLGRRR